MPEEKMSKTYHQKAAIINQDGGIMQSGAVKADIVTSEFRGTFNKTGGSDGATDATLQELLGLLKKLIENRDPGQKKLLQERGYTDQLEAIVNQDVSLEDILPFRKLIYGTALLETPDGYGTAFLTVVPGLGVCFLSAGHSFKSLLVKVSKTDHMDYLNRCKVWFGNFDGKLDAESMNLKTFLERFGFYGSISNSVEGYGQCRTIFKRGDCGINTLAAQNTGEDYGDYCAFLLNDDVRRSAKDLGLEFLPCGDENQIKHKPGTWVTIVGHPGTSEFLEKTNTLPKRYGYGLEVGQTSTMITFDYDSLKGNSGSPVLDRDYKVKGIHISAVDSNVNGAQKLDKIKDWIELGRPSPNEIQKRNDVEGGQSNFKVVVENLLMSVGVVAIAFFIFQLLNYKW